MVIMGNIYNLYMDDSGTRHPDRDLNRTPSHRHDYFALGGVLINDADEAKARRLHQSFCDKWELSFPLHSCDIRAKSKKFNFLESFEKEKLESFMEDLTNLAVTLPVIGIACVIDRPGYNQRYFEKYGRNRWDLCKTAFAICVERSAKYALAQDCKLRVYVERSDKKTDRLVLNYYKYLKNSGMPFDKISSANYDPVESDYFSEILYDFKTKNKSSPLMQIADLYLWPMSIGGYDQNNKAYKALKQNNKLIDCLISENLISTHGIKYSCWELEKTKAR